MGKTSGLVKMSPATEASIINMIMAGAFPTTAAKAHGIGPTTWWEWRKKGKEGKAPYKDFERKISIAESMARVTAEVEVKKTDPKFWLTRGPGRDRGDPNDPGWTDRQSIEVTGTDGRALVPLEAIRLLMERTEGMEDEDGDDE
jgi:hypothetical protein